MKKRDFETYQKRLRDLEILPKFSETHGFRGTIRHPSYKDAMTKNIKTQILHKSYEKRIQKQKQKTSEIACEEKKI